MKSPASRSLLGVVAIAEILGVTLVGNGLARYALGPVRGAAERMVPTEGFGQAALLSAASLAVRFGILLTIAFLVLRLAHRISPGRAGVGIGGRSMGELAGIGVLLFAVASLPNKLILLLDRFVDLGVGIPGWEDYATQALTGGYLLYVLAAQVLLPPVFEEPFGRGYMRTRLARSYGVAGSCLLSGVLFMLGHGHFYEADPLVLLVLLSGIFAATCWAWTTWRTGSIVPAVVAHGLGNVPHPYTAGWLLPLAVAMAACMLWSREPLRRELRAAGEAVRRAPLGLVASGLVVGAGAMGTIVATRPDLLWTGAVALAIGTVGWLPRMRRGGSRHQQHHTGR